MAVMADKAELLELVEQKELTIGQLSGEADTIGRSYNTPPPKSWPPCIEYCAPQGNTSHYTRARERH